MARAAGAQHQGLEPGAFSCVTEDSRRWQDRRQEIDEQMERGAWGEPGEATDGLVLNQCNDGSLAAKTQLGKGVRPIPAAHRFGPVGCLASELAQHSAAPHDAFNL